MPAQEPKPFNKFLLYLLILLMILTGSINTIFNKILQKLRDEIKDRELLFEQHHWIITFGMFLGELVSIFFYIYIVIQRKNATAKNQETLIEGQENTEDAVETPPPKPIEDSKRPPVPTNLVFGITAMCDLCATTINTFGLTYLTTSMFQMMRGLELFFVCLWSTVLLKNPLYRHAVLGVGTLIVGLGLVGLNSLINAPSTDVAKNPVVGMILLGTSQLFSSTEYVIQEKFIKHYEVHPFQLVGFEGLWGSLIYFILLIIFQNVSCDDWSVDIIKGVCFYKNKDFNPPDSHIEDSLYALEQMWSNKAILIVYIFYVVSIALYNIVGINLTKLVSSTARAVVDTVRTVFIWMFFLFFSPVEGTREEFHTLQFIGFCLLVIGTLIYNEILVLPFWNLDYYTRDNIAKREKELRESNLKNEDEQGRLYVSVDGKDNSTANDQNNPNSNEEAAQNDQQDQ
jgi:drug/metabolite transporter (DMT)-like permease